MIDVDDMIDNEHVAEFEKLIQSGVDVNYREKHSKKTMLFYAVESEDFKVATMLLQRGANIDLLDWEK